MVGVLLAVLNDDIRTHLLLVSFSLRSYANYFLILSMGSYPLNDVNSRIPFRKC